MELDENPISEYRNLQMLVDEKGSLGDCPLSRAVLKLIATVGKSQLQEDIFLGTTGKPVVSYSHGRYEKVSSVPKKQVYAIVDPYVFLTELFVQLAEDSVDVSGYLLDHLGYAASTPGRYAELKQQLACSGELLVEAMINSRPIATYRLTEPIQFDAWQINCIELLAPIQNTTSGEGFIHAEFVIQEDFETFMTRYPLIHFDTRRVNDKINACIKIDYGGVAVKFHHESLESVIGKELNN